MEAYRRIAKDSDVNPTTVAYHLDSRYRKTKLRGNRKRYVKKVRKRKYQRNYHRLIRRPETLLVHAFEEAEVLSSTEIACKASDIYEGVHFRTATVDSVLNSYIAQSKGPPYIKETRPSTYTLRKKQEEINLSI